MEKEAWAGTLTLSQYFVQLMRWMEEVFKIDMSNIVVFLLLMYFMVWSQVSRLSDRPYRRRNVHKLFYTLHPCWIHHNLKENNWILLSWKYGNEALYKVSRLSDSSCRRRSVHKLYYTLHPSWIPITSRKIIGSSCPDNMHIYKWQWSIVQSFKACWIYIW